MKEHRRALSAHDVDWNTGELKPPHKLKKHAKATATAAVAFFVLAASAFHPQRQSSVRIERQPERIATVLERVVHPPTGTPTTNL